MENFLNKKDVKLSKEFERKGYVIKKIDNKPILKKIENNFIKFIHSELKIKKRMKFKYLLNNVHKFLNAESLNSFRLKIIQHVNNSKEFKKLYFIIARPYLDILVGNELVMQNKINLSIQIPHDESSLLPIHADIWSGDSPFEIVVWFPLVNCYKSKSMFILPPNKYKKFDKTLSKTTKINSSIIYKKIKKDLKWINIKYGQLLIFNQSLPHGNIVNKEKETRWSMNCRFKSIFSPYGDKKIGEFFYPITLRKMSEMAMKYEHPKLFNKK